MAQFRINHPWDPGYALPPHVMAEPPGTGTLTTAQLPRKTFDDPVPGYTGGFAVPAYIREEPIGRGAATTMWARRKTIPLYVPDALGADAGGAAADALRAYGDQVADVILTEVPKLPPDQRAVGLEALLRAIEPGLLSRVTANMGRGMDARGAISAAVQVGFGREVARLGRGAAPRALGYYGGAEAMGGFWDVISYPFRKIGSGVKTAATKTYDWGGKALSTIGGLTCKLASSQLGAVVGGAGAAAAGAPPQYGVVGAQVAAGVCPPGQVPVTMPPPSTTPPWLLPAAIGGVGLVAVILLTRKS